MGGECVLPRGGRGLCCGGGGVSCVQCTEAHVVLQTLLLEDHGSAGREPRHEAHLSRSDVALRVETFKDFLLVVVEFIWECC